MRCDYVVLSVSWRGVQGYTLPAAGAGRAGTQAGDGLGWSGAHPPRRHAPVKLWRVIGGRGYQWPRPPGNKDLST